MSTVLKAQEVAPGIVQTKHKPGLADFVREMTMAGQFGVDEHGVGIGPMPTNRAQARAAIRGRTRGCGARKRALIAQWKRERGLS